MHTLIRFGNLIHDWLDSTRKLDFLAPLLLRVFLAVVFIAAGWQKASSFESTVAWFGNADWGLGLPLPWLMAFLATAAELVGGFLLLLGLATRYIAVPLIITMLVAALAVHWDNGWFAIAPSNPETSMAQPLAAIGIPAAKRSLENSAEVGERLGAARNILRENGNYRWLTGKGSFVVLNNGIEFAATYFIMLLVLFFYGAGRFVSLDYWIWRRFRR
jgi:putative oxidoreductase